MSTPGWPRRLLRSRRDEGLAPALDDLFDGTTMTCRPAAEAASGASWAEAPK